MKEQLKSLGLANAENTTGTKLHGVEKSTGKFEQLTGRARELYIQLDQLNEKISATPKGQEYDALMKKIIQLNDEYRKLTHSSAKAERTISNSYDKNAVQNFVNSYGKNTTKANITPNVNIEPAKRQLTSLKVYLDKFQKYKINIGNTQLDFSKFVVEINRAKQKAKEFVQNLKQASIEKLKNGIKSIPSYLNKAGQGVKNLASKFSSVKNGASKLTGHLKVGLGQILKMAGALFGLRSIYNVLRNSASAWLNSQNAQAQQLNANIEYMKNALGSALAPVIETIVNLIYQALKGVQSLIYALTGVNIFANASAKAYSSMASSAKNAQKATQSLADIDEIHNIQEDTSSNGSGSGATTPNFDLSGIETADWLQKIIDNLKNGNWYEIGATIGDKINETLDKIPWEKIKEKARNCGKNLAEFLNGGIETTNWKLVGGTIAEGVNTAINFAYNFVKNFNWKSFGKAISETINGFFTKIEWDKAGQTVSDGIKGVCDTLIEFISNLDIGEIQEAILDFLFNIDWAGIFGKLLKLLDKLVIKGIEAPINLAIKAAKKISEKLPPAMQGAFASLQEIHLEDSISSLDEYETELYEIQEQAKETSKETGKNIKEIDDVTVRTFNGLKNKTFLSGKDTVFNYNKGIESQKPATTTVLGKIRSAVQDKLNLSQLSKQWGNSITFKYNSGLNNNTSPIRTTINQIKSKISELNQNSNSYKYGQSTSSNYNSGLNSQNKSLTNVINNIKSKIKSNLNNSSNSYTWGSDMIDGFIRGINSLKSKLTQTVKKVASSISSFLHFSRPDEGPLRDYETWMPDMIKGLSNSLLKSAPVLDNAVTDVAGQIAENLRATDMSFDVNSNINKNINSNLMSSQLENAVYSAIQKAENLFKLTINNELKMNSKTIAQEILDDLNNEAKRRGYKPILQRG